MYKLLKNICFAKYYLWFPTSWGEIIWLYCQAGIDPECPA